MEAGQGKIDIIIKKPAVKKNSVIVSQTNGSGVHLINIEPQITWAKKPLPTKIPQQGSHGGIVFRKREYGISDPNSAEKTYNNMEIYIPDVGFGAGGLVVSGTGPVLLGSGSMGALTHICLPWIAIILIITSICWAIRVILLQVYFKRMSNNSVNGRKNWIGQVIEMDQQSCSRDVSLLNGNSQLLISVEDAERSMLTKAGPPISPVASLSDYSGSIKNSLLKYSKNSTLKKASTASILSYSSTLIGSGIYDIPSWLQTQLTQRRNQVAMGQQSGVLFTVSVKKCPNSFLMQDLSELNVCKPSEYNECAEVLLLCHETVLVGKMRNNHDAINDMPYIVQTWSTTDGSIIRNGYDAISCIRICAIKDEYLIILNRAELLVLQPSTNNCLAQIQLPLVINSIHNTNISMQSTTDMNHIVISYCLVQNLSIYAFQFDNILQGRSEVSKKIYNALSFAVISSSEVIVALTSTDVILWNFQENIETSVSENCNQEIQRFLPSQTLKLVLIQFRKHISIFETDKWDHVFDITVSSDQVCALAFSSNADRNNFLAVALDNGSIQIHDNSSGLLIRTITIDVPVTFLLFDNVNQSLLALSDRASHYILKRFKL